MAVAAQGLPTPSRAMGPALLRRRIVRLRLRWGTVWWYFRRWRREGIWVRMHRALYPLARAKAGRRPGPSVVIMDGQSVKTTEKGAFAASMGTSG